MMAILSLLRIKRIAIVFLTKLSLKNVYDPCDYMIDCDGYLYYN